MRSAIVIPTIAEMIESTQFEKSEDSKEGEAEKDPKSEKDAPPKLHSGKDKKKVFGKRMKK